MGSTVHLFGKRLATKLEKRARQAYAKRQFAKETL